jgi:adenylate cyclase
MTESPARKLAAILAADIAGYSALMGTDEARTVLDLKSHQAVVLPMIGAFGGRIIDTAGDGIMAEFASIVNAVDCPLAIQKVMAERNVPVKPTRRMQFRIGLNFGDVIYDAARIYGDGINVAARLEGLAEPGGICISGKVYEEVHGKLGQAWQFLGEKQLKNIAEPVRVYTQASASGHETDRSALDASLPPHKPSFTKSPFRYLPGLWRRPQRWPTWPARGLPLDPPDIPRLPPFGRHPPPRR